MNQNKKESKYDVKKFRLVKHGTSGTTAYCRHCNFSLDSVKDSNILIKAKKHALKTMHTVDVYKENHNEYTSYAKPK